MAKDLHEYDAIYEYLRSGSYPSDFNKNQRRALRRKASTNYSVDKEHLLYQRSGSWKQVPRHSEERYRILKLCHAHPEGIKFTLGLFFWDYPVVLFVN